MPKLLEPVNIASAVDRLVDSILAHRTCIVAFSGGVDSSVVAKAAYVALGERSVAITGIGPSVSQADIQYAELVSEAIGIRHLMLDTSEIADPNYLANDARRCFHCKTNLYETLRGWGIENRFDAILSGTNFDDLGDYRPGLSAAHESQVVAPLAELGINKSTVRLIAEYWSLPSADRPASPCLASRVAYGESITVEKLQMIELAERWLAERGFHDVRVRLHPGKLARVEVSLEDLARIVSPKCRDELTSSFLQFGFQFVTIDINGRQSGSLNKLLPVIQ